MNQNKFDFTEGSITKKMILFSWPIFFSNILQTSYQFIDSLWVGNLLGAEALGAIAISATVLFTVLSFIIGMNGATLTVLSQQKGKGDQEGLKQSLNAFVVILGGLTLTMGLVGFFTAESILTLLGTPEKILPLATTYLQINFLGILLMFGYNFIGTVLRALGDSKTPIRFVLLAVVLNAILDPFMISVLDGGIMGAAIATITSQGIAFLYGIIYSTKKGGVPFTLPHLPAKRYVKPIVKLGLPAGLQMIAISSGLMFIMAIVSSFGESVVAGFSAAQRIDSIIMLPAFTLGSAVNSMSGQNIGAEKWDRVSLIAKNALITIILLSLGISTIAFFGAPFFIGLFIDQSESIGFGSNYLKSVAFFYPFLGINFVLNGIIRAAGGMVQVLVLNLVSFWILRFPLTYFFAKWWGAQGVAYGIGVSFVVSSLLAILYYRWGHWRKLKIFDEEDKEKA